MGDANFKVTGPFDYIVTWQIQKTCICTSAIPMAVKLGRAVTFCWKNRHTCSSDLLTTWSRDKCKTLYLHFCNIYGHQTGQTSNFKWEDPISKVTWTLDYLVTWQMKKTYIYTSAIPMAIKLGRVVICGEGTQHSKPRDLLITWSRDKWKKLISILMQYLWRLNLAEW